VRIAFATQEVPTVLHMALAMRAEPMASLSALSTGQIG